MSLSNFSSGFRAFGALLLLTAVVFSGAPAVAQEAHTCLGVAADIVGSAGDDILDGTGGNDVIVALQGNDTINGLGGEDVVCAGAGADIVNGGDGRDRLLGGQGGDRLTGGEESDVIVGGAGNDRLRGGTGPDLMLGGPHRDTVLGEPGDDLIAGGDGNDTLRGAGGADIVVGRLGVDGFFGGPGNDAVIAGDVVNEDNSGWLSRQRDDNVDGADGIDLCIVDQKDTIKTYMSTGDKGSKNGGSGMLETCEAEDLELWLGAKVPPLSPQQEDRLRALVELFDIELAGDDDAAGRLARQQSGLPG